MKKKLLLSFIFSAVASTFATAEPLNLDMSWNLSNSKNISEFEINKQKNKALLDSSVDVKNFDKIDENFGFVDLNDDEIKKEIDKISEETKYVTEIANKNTNNNVIVRSRNHNNFDNVVRKNHNNYKNYKNYKNDGDNSYLSLLAKYRDLTQEVILHGLKFIGVKYRFGGDDERQGLDCSGYVRLVFKNSIGLLLPRTASEMSNIGENVAKEQLKPGDLVFFNTMKREFSHVGIYLGDNYFMHAPSTGAEVRVENMESDYWFKRFNGGRRVLGNQNENLNSPRLKQIF